VKSPFTESNTSYLTNHPFGMVMPGRSWTAASAEGYRFGFNGKEGDSEIKGQHNCLNLGARIYDPRLGKFFSGDPKESRYAWQSPYVYYLNSPIKFIDFNGEGGEKHKEKDIKKFRSHEAKLAKREFGIKDYSKATPDEVERVRNRMEEKFKNRNWMWSWSKKPNSQEFSRTNSDHLDEGTSRPYTPMREIVDDADGLLKGTPVTENVPYTTFGVGATITFSADLSRVNVSEGLELMYVFDTPTRSLTADVYQDRVGGGTTMMGSPVARQLVWGARLTPVIPSITTAINVADGNFVTILVTDRTSTAVMGMLSPLLVAHSLTAPSPSTFYITDKKGHYGFWRSSVKMELFRQAGY